jgi:hypothetical protein
MISNINGKLSKVTILGHKQGKFFLERKDEAKG